MAPSRRLWSVAEKVNRAAQELLGIREDELEQGFPGDIKIDGPRIVAKVGLLIRLTRNMDKDRGFVNGALGVVHHVIDRSVFLVRLTTGNLVLAHPTCADDGRAFLPCTYGYASTIRRCQGSTLHHGCIYFDRLWLR